jgi:phosphopantothenoylcysteine decarboxylase/phosphopantothenate--cysteine ligase
LKFLITAGPTREPIDPVRYLSNRSSGKMGYAIARAGIEAGHDVTLITGPVCLDPPRGAQMVRVTTSDEMYDAVHGNVPAADALMMAAAVADFKPSLVAAQKIKKQDATPSIALMPTRDILASIVRPKKSFVLVGFAAETNDVRTYALRKLHVKQCDLIVANDVSRMNAGFDSDDNTVTLYFRSGVSLELSLRSKLEIGREIVRAVSRLAENS